MAEGNGKIPLGQVLRQEVDNDYRTVLAAGAAHRQGEVGLAFLLVAGQQVIHETEQVL